MGLECSERGRKRASERIAGDEGRTRPRAVRAWEKKRPRGIRPVQGKKGEGRKGASGPPAGRAREGGKRRLGRFPGARLKRKEGIFFQFKLFFFNSSIQIQAQFKSNSSIVSNILLYSNKQFC